MTIFLTLNRGPKLYVEYARWAGGQDRPGPWFEIRRDRGELLLWFGRWHAIYTPARWSPEQWSPEDGGMLNGGGHPIR